MAQRLAEPRAQEDGEGAQLDAQRAEAAVRVGALGDQEASAAAAVVVGGRDKGLAHPVGPGRPLLVLLRVGADQEAEEEEEGCHKEGQEAVVGGNPGLGGTVEREVCQQGAEGDHGPKRLCVAGHMGPDDQYTKVKYPRGRNT